MQSNCPEPFRAITELLYSEKKPGDLSCRQVMVDIIQGVLELDFTSPQVMCPKWNTAMLSAAPPIPNSDKSCASNTIQADSHILLKTLMIGPPNEEEQAKVDFIQYAHKPRLFKRWVTELSSVLSDYFWIFCRSSNNFMRLKSAEALAAMPLVPAGNSGGVEAVAMSYCAAQLALLNSLCRTATKESAMALHIDLADCGFDRCLLVSVPVLCPGLIPQAYTRDVQTLRKCNSQYYPQIHLEVSSLNLQNFHIRKDQPTKGKL